MAVASVDQAAPGTGSDTWLYRARRAAQDIARRDATVTIDQVREVCPPPKGVDPRIMGAVFTRKHFEAIGWIDSRRKECHFRPIRIFQIKQQ
jgi:hypothetical protein